jgi:hypothetical protein
MISRQLNAHFLLSRCVMLACRPQWLTAISVMVTSVTGRTVTARTVAVRAVRAFPVPAFAVPAFAARVPTGKAQPAIFAGLTH